MFLFLICGFFKHVPIDEGFLNFVDGKWEGRIVKSESIDDIPFTKNITVKFSKDSERNFTSVILESNDGEYDNSFFLQMDPENPENDTLLIADRFGEPSGKISIFSQGDMYIIRGILPPKNDQITGLVRTDSFVFSITDQFSKNVTSILLSSTASESKTPFYIQTFLFLAVGVTIVVSIFKVTDLTDVIKPEEAKYTEMVKAKSKRDAKIKEAKEYIKKQEEEERKRQQQNQTEEGKVEND